jgi:hypothetical protein
MELIFYCVAVALVGIMCAGILFCAYRDLRSAKKLLRTIEGNIEASPPAGRSGPICIAIRDYLRSFATARNNHVLPQFQVDSHLGQFHRACVTVTNSARAGVGVTVLLALIVTLMNLQGAVRSLGNAFDSLSTEQQATLHSAGNENGNLTVEQQQSSIKGAMSHVADAAGKAFRWSLIFISIAVLTLLCSIWLQGRAGSIYRDGWRWAQDEYARELPAQLPLSQGDVALRLSENIAALERLVFSINNLTGGMGAFSSFGMTLEQARDAIVTAVDKLPGEIHSSVNTLSSDLVAELSKHIANIGEQTKKILAIYGHQQYRIDEIGSWVQQVKELLVEMTAVVKQLSSVPDAVMSVLDSVRSGTNAVDRLSAVTSDLKIAVDELPKGELKAVIDAVNNALDAVNSIQSQLASTIEDFNQKSGDVELIRTHLQPVMARIESTTVTCVTEVTRLAAERKIVDTEVTAQFAGLLEHLKRISTDRSRGPEQQLIDIQQLLREIQTKLDSLKLTSKWSSWFTARSGN